MKSRKLAIVALLAAPMLPWVPAAGDEPGPWSIEAIYTADVLHNASGGIDTGTGALQNFDLVFDVDFERWREPRNGRLKAYLLWNDDNRFSSRYSGDAQVVSNIDAVGAFRLFELWYERKLAEAIGLRVGLYDLNSEFDAIEAAALFINSSHGIGADYGQTGENGPSIFPVTSLAARLQWQPGEGSIVRYALLDAVPGDPDDPSATQIDLGSGDGLLHALEFDRSFGRDARLALGGFLYSADFETVEQPVDGPRPRQDDGNAGVYALAEGTVFRRESRSVWGFVRIGVANQALNPFSAYVGAGAVFAGFLHRRPYDYFGVALASARTGDDFRRAGGADAHETTFELTYSAHFGDWLRIQPDIQYVINPGANPSLQDAFVVGIRVEAIREFPY